MIETLQQQRALPHSEEAERAVLAAAILDPPQLPAVAGRLAVDDFYGERHQILYRAMLDLQEQGTTIDIRTLQARLEQRNQLEAVGGLGYISSLDLDLPDLGRIDAYVEIVKERSLRRRLIRMCSDVSRDCLDGGVDAQAALASAEQIILALGEESVQRGFESVGSIVKSTLADLETRTPSTMIGLETGFADFDEVTRGLNRGNLIIIAGRPGMGKTSFAVNIAQWASIHRQNPVGVFSLEMSKQELTLRVLSSESGINFGKLRSGHLSQKEWGRVLEAERAIAGAPLFIDDSASPTLLEVGSKARRLRAERGLDLVVLDYLQLMQAGGRYENRNLEIGAITRGLKQLAKELDIPVVALSQLSRQPERRGGDHRPQLADLRESGSIEQDADLVAFIYRDVVYNKDEAQDNSRDAELIIAKHRNGETRTIPLVFLGETTTFKSSSKYDGAAPF